MTSAAAQAFNHTLQELFNENKGFAEDSKLNSLALAQQHANQAQLSKQKAPLWALQLGAHSSISSTVLAAKRLHPYRKQFKLLRQSQKQKATVKKNSVKKQRIHSVRVSEPVLAADQPRRMQIQVKRAKQRLAKLQRRQWANGVVSFASKRYCSGTRTLRKKPDLPGMLDKVRDH
ncbi:hypothetical protein ABBQ38_007395 [Trebouxia sp. C0009 RCD-2024]